MNYNPNDPPRTQDIKPIYIETSAFYLFSKELFLTTSRRIGYNPFVELDYKESIDIDTKDDFELAKKLI